MNSITGEILNYKSLSHHGIKGQKWGIRRTPEELGNISYSTASPKIEDNDGNYTYKKGTVVGRYGNQQLNEEPMYLFTNEKDKEIYKNHIGGEEQKFVLKKDVKMPNETNQILELYNFTKDDAVINEPYYYWKDKINQAGPTSEGYFKYMLDKGYDALIDIRNSGGISNDPIIILNPEKCLTEIPINDELMHYGVKRRSGRYPWGSGEDPYQHSGDFLSRVEELSKKGLSEKEIADSMKLTTTELRTQKSLANAERRSLDVARAKSLKEDGLGATEIARKISEETGRNIPESTVRSWLNADSERRMKQAEKTAEFLKEKIKEKGMIDVGAGVEISLGVSKEKLNQALKILEDEGYPVYGGRVDQVTNPGKKTTIKVLCPPGTEHKEIFTNVGNIKSLDDYTSHDGGETFNKFVYPRSLDSKRVMIRYAEDGGALKDGVVEIRRGAEGLSLGNSHYSQVRILVDDNKYIKGMAIYSDGKDMPPGVDLIVNSNKKREVGLEGALKTIKNDPDNPFGSTIKANGQSYYTDKNGKQQLSYINKRADEGDWTEWKDKLPAQFLSKQSLSMAKKQLGLAQADKEAEFDEIMNLTNPTVKKQRLRSFAEDCDSAAVHLQAAALPSQKYHVILPNNTLKENEIYAPGYENGTQLALIRYPHGGTFEIPILTVNNKNKLGQEMIGTKPIDAVTIHHTVAERLSGADFDGDTVMAIPTHDPAGKVKITSTRSLEGLKGFDSKSYQYDTSPVADENGVKHYYRNGKEFKIMKATQKEMGVISNLITDMTLLGASTDELARAVRHSMVVIDAEKHKLDYKQSFIDNNIAELKEKYQPEGGASTLISRAKGQQDVVKRQGSPKVNIKGKEWYDPSKPEGSLVYKTADDAEYSYTKVNKRTGEETVVTNTRKQVSTKMAEAIDARSLISKGNTAMENVYADYANTMKRLANKARLEAESTGKIAYSPAAKKAYASEVQSLDDKLKQSLANAPKERQAQLLANAEVNAKKQANPDMSKEDIKKASQQALVKYREQVGAKRTPVDITDKEWEAIQAGAISENKLTQILNHTDKDRIRELSTPRLTNELSQAKVNKLKAMSNSNYSLTEIAKALGVSTSTVSNYLKGDK